MTRIEGVITAHSNDPYPTITVTSTDGAETIVRLWYDRKFGRGLRMGDTVALQLNKQDQYGLKTLLVVSDGEPLDFGNKFPKPYVEADDKVAALLVP